MNILLATAVTLAIALPASAAPVDDRAAVEIGKPQELIVDSSLTAASIEAILKPVDAFYGFWNNGSQTLLDAAISPQFIDRTLPEGRPQGPTGPGTASRAFLAAVPDLKVEVTQRLVVQDRVVSHLRFTGHFTGTFMGTSGAGQPIDFIATDIVRVVDGRITDNWHLEDNLKFMQQIGLAH